VNNQLTDSQLVILSSASTRASRSVLPLPSALTLNKGSAALVLKSLIGRGLIAEASAGREDEVWREHEDGGRVTLRMTDAAFRALGIEIDDGDAPSREPQEPAGQGEPLIPAPERPEAFQPGPGTKLAILLELLRQAEGASIDELMAATGWQAHSVRGAISGSIKRKLGMAVETFLVEGRGRIYRIAGAEAAPAMAESVQ
jgi:hypothetical protein